MLREEVIDRVYHIVDAYNFIRDYDFTYENWFKNDHDFDRWAEYMFRDMNWDEARLFLNELPEEYESGYYLRANEDDDSDWRFYNSLDESPDWLINYIVDEAEACDIITDDNEDEEDYSSDSNSYSSIDTLEDTPKPEDTISFEDFVSLFTEVA